MNPSQVLRMQQTRALRMPTPKEGQSAHTISQRIRTLKKMPVELLPIGFVLLVAVGAGVYTSGRKFMHDKTLRLSRSKPEDRG